MAKRTYILMAALVLLVGALVSSSVIAQGTDDPPAEDEEYPEESVRELFDENGKIVTTDDRLAKIAMDHEGGFGGYYFDRADKGHVYVFMTNPTKTQAAREAFQKAYAGGTRTVTQITPVQGDYTFDQLLTWYRALDRAMIANGIHPGAGAVLEGRNRIWFVLGNIDVVDDIHDLMRELNIPEGAVVFEEAVSELLGDEDSVNEKWRPLVGGVQHKIRIGSSYCTVGFITQRGGVNGLVTASHCTNEDFDIGGLDDANIYQPRKHLIYNNKVAEETIDPSLAPMEHEDCPDNYICRYSDSAFAEMESGQDIDRGHIAKPEEVRETDVDPAGTTFEIDSESSGISRDDIVHYIGARRGWRTAEVIDDCAYYSIRPPLYDILGERIVCTGLAMPNDGGYAPGGGDSGAPVFLPGDDNEVELAGVLFARTGSAFHFGKIGLVYWELGASETWNSCTSGC